MVRVSMMPDDAGLGRSWDVFFEIKVESDPDPAGLGEATVRGQMNRTIRLFGWWLQECSLEPTATVPARVGAVTRALVELLRGYSHEPWIALEHRLRARILARQPHQWPGVEGRRLRVPFTTVERSLQEGALPCVAQVNGRWRCVMGNVLGAQEGALYRITDDPVTPGGKLARMDREKCGLTSLAEDPVDEGAMRWALPIELARGVQIRLRQMEGPGFSASLRGALFAAGADLVDSNHRWSDDGEDPSIEITSRAQGFFLHDPWRELVMHWREEPSPDAILPWLGRLSMLERWLGVAETPSPELKGAFSLDWCVRSSEGKRNTRIPLQEARISVGTEVGIEMINSGVEPRLYLSVFRVTGDRGVEHFTRASAGGVPCTMTRPTRLGAGDKKFVLSRPQNLESGAEVLEALVAVVTVRPLSLHLVERPPIRRGPPTGPLAHKMTILWYRLLG